LDWVHLPQKTHNRMLFFGITPLNHGCHFDYWNQPLNMHMHVCYLDYHEAGLCCYLVICVGNLSHPLHLFYFRLWPIYWCSLMILTVFQHAIRGDLLKMSLLLLM
jgi:hypothetical protein